MNLNQELIDEICVKECTNFYFREVLPKVRKDLEHFKQDVGKEGEKLRIAYLEERIIDLMECLEDLYGLYDRYSSLDYDWQRMLIAYWIDVIEKDRNRMVYQVRILENPKSKRNGIAEDIIEMARQVPMATLIEVKGNFALCPFHDDHNPSFYVKNNYGKCFGCGWHGDVIDFVMQKDGLSFREAIERLTLCKVGK